uniref:Melanoma associated antigen (Mutated) 1 n=2 Tax=Nothobranchius TaxID=28779 RepID=A0A1A8LXE4_9TELE
MDAMIGNACLRIVREMAKMQGRDVFVADLHVTRTWLPPTNCDPLLHFPKDADQKDAIIIPLWIPGHFLLSVMRPLQKEISFLDSHYFRRADGFSSQAYRNLLRLSVLCVLVVTLS